jgi:hypothetical protein
MPVPVIYENQQKYEYLGPQEIVVKVQIWVDISFQNGVPDEQPSDHEFKTIYKI